MRAVSRPSLDASRGGANQQETDHAQTDRSRRRGRCPRHRLARRGRRPRPALTTAPQSQWLALDALQVKVEALGYKVRKGKLKKACGEFYATDKAGARVELFVDPTNGAIVGRM